MNGYYEQQLLIYYIIFDPCVYVKGASRILIHGESIGGMVAASAARRSPVPLQKFLRIVTPEKCVENGGLYTYTI